MKHGLFEAGVVFAGILVNQTLNNKLKKIESDEKQFFGNIKMSHKHAKHFLGHAKQMNDDKLIKQGQFGNLHRTTKYAFNKTKQKLITWDTKNYRILDRKTLYLYRNKYPKEKRGMNFEQYERYNRAAQEQGDVLCNGGQLRVRLIHT